MEYKFYFLVFSILIILLSLINIIVIYNKIIKNVEDVTGFASGYVNISVNSVIAINLSVDKIDWGAGIINGTGVDRFNSTLYTQGEDVGLVLRGNWSGENARALVLQNLGTINCSIWIRTNKTAHDFFNSATNSNEEYKLNVSNKDPDSCSGGSNLSIWTDVNQTGLGTKYCSDFSSRSTHNEIFIDILLTVPYDTNYTGRQNDYIVITADVSG